MQEADITAFSLTDYSTLVEVAREKGYIEASDLDKLMEWRKNPDRVGEIKVQVFEAV